MRKTSVCRALPAWFLLLALFSWAGVFAGNTGKIAGTVKDAGNKSPLIGVNVLVQGTSFGAITDEKGEYQILGLPPGSYALRLTLMGYRRTVVENIRVSIDFTTALDVDLASTVIESDETVTIVAEKPLVRKDMTGSLSTVGADEIANLPVRNVEDILQLQAGVIRQGGTSTSGAAGGVRWRTGWTAYPRRTCTTDTTVFRLRRTRFRKCRS